LSEAPNQRGQEGVKEAIRSNSPGSVETACASKLKRPSHAVARRFQPGGRAPCTGARRPNWAKGLHRADYSPDRGFSIGRKEAVFAAICGPNPLTRDAKVRFTSKSRCVPLVRASILAARGATMSSTINPMASVLQEMDSMTAQATGGSAAGASSASAAAGGGDFASMLKTSLDNVSGAQQSSQSEANAFEMGSPNVGLNDVMVDMQKASIGFQEAVQVRNKLVSAYNTIMQMSV
jgi:flagellar hook-basal body complex protein FliE